MFVTDVVFKVMGILFGLLFLKILLRYIEWIFNPLQYAPGPPCWSSSRNFWVGTFFVIQKEPFMQPHLRWMNQDKYFDWNVPFFCYTGFLGKATVITMDKEVIKDILTAPYGKDESSLRFVKHMRFLRNILGDGLVTAEGTHWMRHRQIIQPAFFTQVLKESLNGIVPTLTRQFIQYWKQAQGREIDVVSHLSSLTLDIIGKVAFSHEFNALQAVQAWAEEAKLETTTTTIETTSSTTNTEKDSDSNGNSGGSGGGGSSEVVQVDDPLIQAFVKAFQPNFIGTIAFLLELPWMSRYFNPSTRKIRAALTSATDQVIDNAKKKMMNEESSSSTTTTSSTTTATKPPISLLQLLMEAAERDKDSAKTLTKEELRDEATTFIFAGHETTATWCCMAIYSLVKYPGIQSKVYKDVMKHAPQNPSIPLDLTTVDKMEYFHAFLQEVLRLHPPVGTISRVTTQDETFQSSSGGNGKKYVIPKGTRMFLSKYLLHRNPNYWDDPETFLPERWIDRSADDEQKTRFAFLPFSAGGRNCIGQRFATVEAKLIMAEIVRSLELQLAPSQQDTEFTFTNRVVLKTKPSLQIVVKSRD